MTARRPFMCKNLIKYQRIVPLKKLVKTAGGASQDTNHGLVGVNPCPKCSSVTVEEHDKFTTLIEMLPNVIQTLKGAGKVNEFID